MKKGVIIFGFLGLFIAIIFLSKVALTKEYWSVILIFFVLLLFITIHYIKNRKFRIEDLLLSNQLRNLFEKRDRKIRKKLKFNLKKEGSKGFVILGKDTTQEDKNQYDHSKEQKEEDKGLFNMFD